jgi:cell division protein FtsL
MKNKKLLMFGILTYSVILFVAISSLIINIKTAQFIEDRTSIVLKLQKLKEENQSLELKIASENAFHIVEQKAKYKYGMIRYSSPYYIGRR